MTIRDLMEILIDDQEIQIYDLDKDKIIFDGMYSELEDEHEDLADTKITSLDNIGEHFAKVVVININSEE